MRKTATWVVAATAAALVAGCASVPKSTGPAYPVFLAPEIPARLPVSSEVKALHTSAWQRFQSGDLRAAGTAYENALKRQPAFYPAETGLGLVAMAGRQYKRAITRLNAALARDSRYLPALHALAASHMGLDDIDGAVAALERVIAIDPTRETDRTRLDLLRVRQVQQLTETARRARSAGRHADSADAFRRALAISPMSTTLARELALEELALGQIAEAEARIRRALPLDTSDAELRAALGAVLEKRGRLVESAAAYERAAGIDPKWRSKAEAAREAADRSGLPDELADLAKAATVTRGHLAALIGVRLEAVLARAPRRPPSVATDVRTHFAAKWITPVVQAGVMDISPNHTFSPTANVRRSDLAQILARLIPLALTGRKAELTTLQAAKPAMTDVPATSPSYRAAALAVSAGALQVNEAGQFEGSRPATGAEVMAAIARLGQMSQR